MIRRRGRSMIGLASVLAASLLLLAIETAPAGAQEPTGNPVVVVIFDEFPTAALLDGSNRISGSRFPNFAGLASEATWYRFHTGSSSFTASAVPSILSGRAPVDTYPDFRAHPETIYSLFHGAGYSVRDLEPYTQLCPPGICDRGGRPVIDPLPSESPHEFGTRVLESVPDRAAERSSWITGLGTLTTRELAVGHIKLPHGPYEYLPDGRMYEDFEKHQVVAGPERIVRKGKSGLLETYEKRLLMQVGYVDALLGRVVRSLKRSGRWNETTLVVTADHGVSLTPGFPRRKVVKGNRFSVGPVPLLIKSPGQTTGELSDRMTNAVDILPTVAETVGLGDSLYETAGLPIPAIPEGRVTSMYDGQGGYVEFNGWEIAGWLERDARRRVERMGYRGLDALGPLARKIGTRVPTLPAPERESVSIPQLEALSSQGRRSKLPPLIEGYLSGREIPRGRKLLLTLGNRVVASSTIFKGDRGLAFSFLIHPRYLKGRTPEDMRIFREAPSGEMTRVY